MGGDIVNSHSLNKIDFEDRPDRRRLHTDNSAQALRVLPHLPCGAERSGDAHIWRMSQFAFEAGGHVRPLITSCCHRTGSISPLTPPSSPLDPFALANHAELPTEWRRNFPLRCILDRIFKRGFCRAVANGSSMTFVAMKLNEAHSIVGRRLLLQVRVRIRTLPEDRRGPSSQGKPSYTT